MTTFTFSDRDTWLAYRAEWKAKYRNQSDLIRGIKRELREEVMQERASNLQSQLHYARIKANELMKELNAAKEFKAQQFAAKAALAA